MAKQQTHTERQHQRAQKKKRTQRDHPKDSSVKLTDIPLLNLRIGISVVLTLMSIALALKCFEFPVPGSEKETTINIASVGIDDANIFMTYAQNIAEGHGAVYYPGGPRVEGFSSPLYLLLCTAGMYFTDGVEFYLLLLNAVLLLAVIITLQVFIHGLGKESIDGKETSVSRREMLIVNWAASALLWAWIVVSPPFIIWVSATMMDVGLWTFVFVSGSVAAVKLALEPETPSRRLGLWIVLLQLTRPESFYLCLVWISVIVVARVKQGHGFTKAVAGSKGLISTYLIAVAVIVTGRYLYFGYPLPNTYYAKVSTDFLYNLKLGFGYAWGFIQAQPWVAVALLLNVVILIKTLDKTWEAGTTGESDANSSNHPSQQQQAFSLIALISLLAVLTPVLTGGDHFNYSRFFQPYWPLLVLAGIYFFRQYFLIESLPTMRKPVRVGMTTIALAGTMLLAQQPPWNVLINSPGARPTLANEFQLALGGRQLGDMLNRWQDEMRVGSDETSPYASLGTLTTGGIGFTYDGPVLDMLGLNNLEMAHSAGDRKGNKNHAAFDKDVFFTLSPTLFAPRRQPKALTKKANVFPFRSDGVDSFWQSTLDGLQDDQRFNEQYLAIEIVELTDSGEQLGRCTVWVRQSYLEELNGHTTDHFSYTVLN